MRPSGNVASTCTSGSISGTPAMTWSRREDPRPLVHQVRDGGALPGALDHPGGQQRHGLGMVEPDAAGEPVARDHPGDGQQELLDIAGGQVHNTSNHRPVIGSAPCGRPRRRPGRRPGPGGRRGRRPARRSRRRLQREADVLLDQQHRQPAGVGQGEIASSISATTLGWMPSVGSSRMSSRGLGDQGPGDRQLLALTAGQQAGPPAEQRRAAPGTGRAPRRSARRARPARRRRRAAGSPRVVSCGNDCWPCGT